MHKRILKPKLQIYTPPLIMHCCALLPLPVLYFGHEAAVLMCI